MNKIWIVGLLSFLLLLSSCGLTKEACKNVALKEASEWQDLGKRQGLNDCFDMMNEQRDEMMDKFIPSENCMTLIKDQYTMQYICEGDEYYDELI